MSNIYNFVCQKPPDKTRVDEIVNNTNVWNWNWTSACFN